MTYALASRKESCVAMFHLEIAIVINKDFECDFKETSQVNNLQSYA